MQPFVIGIAGKKRAGKDTCASVLEECGFYRDSFAAPVRAAVANILGITVEQMEHNKETPIRWLDDKASPRSMMQTLGTEWGREMVHPDLWLRALVNRIAGKQLVVISDVRFDNEAKLIRTIGGRIVVIERPSVSSSDSHVSEKPIDDSLVNAWVRNDGSIYDLKETFKDIVNTWLLERMQ